MVLLFAGPAVAAPGTAAPEERPPPGEVDAFMERVFESRRAAWKRLGDFDLGEIATWRIGRAGELPVAASRVEYRWSVRGGVALQSPVAVDGVAVGDRHRRAYERRFRHDERRRREGRDSRPRPLGREELQDRVDEILESDWEVSAGRGLRRRLAGDALLLGDAAAAVALYTGDLLEELGGVPAVGFAEALDRTEALLRLGEQGRLSGGEARRALRGPLAALSDRLDLHGEAGPDDAARFLDLALRASLLESGGTGPAGADARAGEARRGGAAATGEAALVRVRERLAAEAPIGGAGPDFFPGHGVRLDPDRVEPRFVVDHHYYTDWTFEPGRFYLVGREAVAGGEALRIEYYPLDARQAPAGEEDGFEGEDFGEEDFVDRVVGSVHRRTLHTFRVDPATLDLVEHTVENGGLPGFPLRWLLRVDGFRAEMALAPLAEDGPLGEIRMPKRVEVRGSLSTGLGDLEVVVTREFFDYRRTAPADPILPAAILPDAVPPDPVSPDAVSAEGIPPEPVSPAAETAGSPEVAPPSPSPAPGESPSGLPGPGGAAEVRVFGNAALADTEVLRLAGLEPGEVPAPGSEERVAARLRTSGRFGRVAVRRRFRSLTPGREPTTVFWVEERRTVSARSSGSTPTRREASPIPAPVVFPILNYDDGYGATYGARLTAPDPVGERSRLSLPLSWGGLRRAALEFEVRPTRGPFSLVRAGVSASERENPHYLLRDRRSGFAVGAERRIGERWKFVGGADWSRVRFGDRRERLGAYRLGLERDTRSDRLFPRSGAFLRAGWQGLRAAGGPVVHRPHLDARGFVGLFGRSVLAVRARYEGASAPLPPYARPLFGGMDSVRGHRVGAEAADRLAAASVELRSPLNGPLEAHRWGVRLFYDFGAVAAAGEKFRRAPLRRGLGAGVFLRAPFLTLLLDVASDLEGGGRVHLSTTARF